MTSLSSHLPSHGSLPRGPLSRSGVCRLLLFFLICLPLPAAGAQDQPPQTETADTLTADTFALYTRCSFRPQGSGCAAAYQKALTETSPEAAAVRRAFHDYAHYLTPTGGGLTATDRRFLTDSAIALPQGLTREDLAGLHNVINDPALTTDKTARKAAVNNFLSRAVEAELYCDLSSCKDSPGAALSAGADGTAS